LRLAGTRVTLDVVGSPQDDLDAVPHASAPLVAGSAAPWDESHPTASLTTLHNLVSLYTATPIEQLKFHGDADLSACVFVRGSRDAIAVRVVVTDDIHAPNEAANEMWKGDSVQIAFQASGGQYYEWTGALLASGPHLARDFATPSALASATGESFDAARQGTQTTYTLTLPASLPGVTQALKDGCGLDVLVNDNDGAGRKGWLEWTPGIGNAKDPSSFTHVVFK
jgi:hypothetical protein